MVAIPLSAASDGDADVPNLDHDQFVDRVVCNRQRHHLQRDEMSALPLRLLWLGQNGLRYSNERTASIQSKETLLDFDVVICSVRGLGSEFGQSGSRPASTTDSRTRFYRQQLLRRNREFAELSAHGRALVVLPDHFGSIFKRET